MQLDRVGDPVADNQRPVVQAPSRRAYPCPYDAELERLTLGTSVKGVAGCPWRPLSRITTARAFCNAGGKEYGFGDLTASASPPV